MLTARRALRRRPRLLFEPASLIAASSCGVPVGAGPRTMCVRTSGAESERLGVLRRGRFTRPGTSSRLRVQSARTGTLRACGDRIPVPDGVECPRPGRHAPRRAGCPRLRGSVPAWGDTHSVVRPRRRGTSLWTVPPQIEDVLFGRGLRSPSEGDGSGAVVWGRSTSWAQNAVLDGPGRSYGALVETGQSGPAQPCGGLHRE